jgi:hypothetical protein
MSKMPVNHGKPITKGVINQVKDLAIHNTPTRVIGLKIGRTEDSVYGIATKNNISLKPTNQSPYGTKKK